MAPQVDVDIPTVIAAVFAKLSGGGGGRYRTLGCIGGVAVGIGATLFPEGGIGAPTICFAPCVLGGVLLCALVSGGSHVFGQGGSAPPSQLRLPSQVSCHGRSTFDIVLGGCTRTVFGSSFANRPLFLAASGMSRCCTVSFRCRGGSRVSGSNRYVTVLQYHRSSRLSVRVMRMVHTRRGVPIREGIAQPPLRASQWQLPKAAWGRLHKHASLHHALA